MSPYDKPVRSGKQKRNQLTSQRRRARQQKSAAVSARRLQAKIDAGTYIIADTSKQAPNNSYDPPTFYEDTEFACLDCGKLETWTARQQQWWYEVARGSIYARAVRCRSCRRKKRERDQPQP